MNRSRLRSWLALVAVAGAAATAVRSVGDVPAAVRSAPPAVSVSESPDESAVDRTFREAWTADGVSPAGKADDLTLLRRASLALHGTIPSLEEIRAFEADARPDRFRHAVRRMLADARFADYWSERLARVWVGTNTEPFLVYRRDRFTRWLAEQLRANRPYDDLVRAVITTDGLWTSEPAANFVTARVVDDEPDENALAARTVRAFLGQRIDCAQCHDHPFAAWKQSQFEGLAAFYGQSAVSLQGVVDQPRLFENELEFRVDDPASETQRVVAPAVPFLPECLPAGGSRRARLAAWVTDPRNDRFGRATANRVWGLVFGKPYFEPLDDLPDPGDESTAVLDEFARGFRESGYDLRGLIEAVVLSRPFRLASRLDGADEAAYRRAEHAWAVFPLSRLRPDQVIGALVQAGRLTTIDRNSNLLARTVRYFREQDFVRDYGDLGEAELEPRSGTVPQALLRMNGSLTREILEANPVTATGRLAMLAPDDDRLVELCFLVALTRRPTDDERSHFVEALRGTTGDERSRAVEDLLWALANSAEFSWNH